MTKEKYSVLIALFALFVLYPVKSMAQNIPPIADAGLSRYAASDPLQLDGTGSFDPDGSGSLGYSWRQIDGPSVVITDASAAKPTISGFVQTDEIQECEFELVVSDGELTSLPDTVKVIIVPDFGASTLQQENPPFDPNKPTVISFGGGDCRIGFSSTKGWSVSTWNSRANVIRFPNGYWPDSGGGAPTYYKYGDMIIVYLSAVTPDYKQPIQSWGNSTGTQPAVDVGIHLNLAYADPRYAVNRVTLREPVCRDYSESISQFLASSVDGEQCWVDNYLSRYGSFYPNILNIGFEASSHSLPAQWYRNSLTGSDMNQFNNGVVGGAYWSVIGPGKNLQLAPTPDTQTYKFKWYGYASSGYMDFFDEPNHPGRLPEPVRLLGPVDVGDPNGAILTCEESENAVGYQLLFGSDPYRVMDYNIISDTPTPPDEIITTLPFEKTWWTVRVRDQYGSTIHADPIYINPFILSLPIENLTTGKRYGYIQHAIDDVAFGDEIVASEGIYQENIDFKGKSLTVRSTNPDDPATVAATVINGGHQGSVITMSGSQDGDCVLAGLTIIGGTVGISCRDASPTIRNCTIESNGPIAIEFWYGYEPIIIDCTILGQVKELNDPRLLSHWKLDETEGSIAYDSAGVNDGTVHEDPAWQPAGGQIDGALAFDGIDNYLSIDFVLNPMDGAFSVFAWIKGGAPGQVVISQTAGTAGAGSSWLCTDPSEGKFMASLTHAVLPLKSDFVITDGQWHDIGLVYDGSSKYLYVDGAEVAKDDWRPLLGTNGGLYIGAGKNLEAGTFFSGLIDDVRIYDRAVIP